MATKNTMTIAITLKNGQCFEHHPPKESFNEQLEFLNEILNELAKRHSGFLNLTYPVAIYRMDDISSIHFPDMTPSADIPHMGYLKNLEGINKNKG